MAYYSSLKLTENLILIGDFNHTLDNMGWQMGGYDLRSLIKETTCFKGDPICIDLILTNNKSHFKHSKTLVIVVSDFLKLIATAAKTNFVKSNPTIKY